MTKWEQWLSQQKSRKDIICAVFCNDAGGCGNDCLMYPICKEHSEAEWNFFNLCDEYLDSEAKDTRETVVANLMIMMEEAEERGLVGDAKTLTRAIELLKEE